jgi:hypothetical protein
MLGMTKFIHHIFSLKKDAITSIPLKKEGDVSQRAKALFCFVVRIEYTLDVETQNFVSLLRIT